MVDDEQILRFFNWQSSPEETDKVASYLKDHPEILNKYLSDKDWENFKTSNKIDPQLSDKFWTNIASASLKKKSYRLSFFIKTGAVAACAILCTGVWYVMSLKSLKPETGKASTSKTADHIIRNNGKGTMFLRLTDGTQVKLLPAGSIAYSSSFSVKNRNILLHGEAIFHAIHSKIPFTVKTNVLSVTDMGTVFSVCSFDKDSMIRIELFEGAVSVNLINRPGQSYSLKPGDKLLYNKISQRFGYLFPEKNNQQITAPKSEEVRRNLFSGNNWYLFNNQSLASVFDQLSKIYNTTIAYSASDIQGLTFIGRLDKSDSLGNLLKSIASLNGLHVRETGNGYRIYK